MQVYFDTSSLESYRLFMRVKSLPTYRITGRTATFPDEYAGRLGIDPPRGSANVDYVPHPMLFDYQRDIARLAIRKKRFAVFARPGLGKTLIATEFLRHASAALPPSKCCLLIAPPMVVNQHLGEIRRFYGDSLPVRQVMANELHDWLLTGTERIGVTNYEAIREGLQPGRLGCIVADESSIFKSHYGKWGTRVIELGKGLEYKLALTGTPAPNDQIEYGNHAVFLDQFPNVNSFLARYFINRGQTNERWELKQHALESFYRSLSHWCIFLTNPAVYGWRDNCDTIPPVHVHIHNVDLTPEQEAAVQKECGGLFAHRIGGIVSRGKLARLAKGYHDGREIATNKPGYIKRLVESWSHEESTIVWCEHNDEQDRIADLFPDAANIEGKTPMWRRVELLEDFQAGRRKILISKARVLGFGLNLQIATRHIFSGLRDSYESYYQAICRSNRIGSTRPLNVHLPITDVEEPMIQNVLRKAKRVQQDTETQERIFRQAAVMPELIVNDGELAATELAANGIW